MTPDAIARAVAYAISQPDDVDVSEMIVRPVSSAGHAALRSCGGTISGRAHSMPRSQGEARNRNRAFSAVLLGALAPDARQRRDLDIPAQPLGACWKRCPCRAQVQILFNRGSWALRDAPALKVLSVPSARSTPGGRDRPHVSREGQKTIEIATAVDEVTVGVDTTGFSAARRNSCSSKTGSTTNTTRSIPTVYGT